MTPYRTWPRSRLIARIKELEPYEYGMHKLAKEITHRDQKAVENEQRLQGIDKIREVFHGRAG